MKGDNSVLMQKVAKELITGLQKGYISADDVRISGKYSENPLKTLHELLVLRRNRTLTYLANAMQEGMGNGKSLFDVWMKEQSDAVQGCARYLYKKVFFF